MWVKVVKDSADRDFPAGYVFDAVLDKINPEEYWVKRGGKPNIISDFIERKYCKPLGIKDYVNNPITRKITRRKLSKKNL